MEKSCEIQGAYGPPTASVGAGMGGGDGRQCSIVRSGSRSVVQQYAPISNAEAATGRSVVTTRDTLDATVRRIASSHLLAGVVLAGLPVGMVTSLVDPAEQTQVMETLHSTMAALHGWHLDPIGPWFAIPYPY
jgi:hypothetical protein